MARTTGETERAPHAPIAWRNILVGVDHSDLGQLALARGIELSAQHGSTLHVVQALPIALGATPGAVPPSPIAVTPGAVPDGALSPNPQEVDAQLRRRVGHEVERLRLQLKPPSIHVRSGFPATVIKEVAREVDADLVVLGSHGRSGLRRVLLGSVSESVLRSISCTVLLVRPKVHGDDAAG